MLCKGPTAGEDITCPTVRYPFSLTKGRRRSIADRFGAFATIEMTTEALWTAFAFGVGDRSHLAATAASARCSVAQLVDVISMQPVADG
jgi:hypothetical protein